jgi:hypothetical protein
MHPTYLPAHRRSNRIPICLPPTIHLFINLPLHLCIPSPSASLDGGHTRVHRSRQAKRSALTPPPMEAPTAHRNFPHTTIRPSQSPPDSDRRALSAARHLTAGGGVAGGIGTALFCDGRGILLQAEPDVNVGGDRAHVKAGGSQGRPITLASSRAVLGGSSQVFLTR